MKKHEIPFCLRVRKDQLLLSSKGKRVKGSQLYRSVRRGSMERSRTERAVGDFYIPSSCPAEASPKGA